MHKTWIQLHLFYLGVGAVLISGCDVDKAGLLSRCSPACPSTVRKAGIKLVKADAWFECHRLSNIDLSFNELDKFPRNAARSAATIRSMNLGHNSIRSVSGDDLAAATLLTNVDLSHNNISEVSIDLLEHSDQMRKLDLSYNKLSFLPRSVAVQMKKLQFVDLAGNPGSHGCTKALSGDCTFSQVYHQSLLRLSFCLCGLQSRGDGPAPGGRPSNSSSFVDLSRRNVGLLEKDAFKHGRFAWVQHTSPGRQLASVAKDAYAGSPGITALNLHKAGLTSVDALAFNGLTLLETLDISYNDLNTLPAGVFAPLVSIKTISLHTNAGWRNCPYPADRRCRFGQHGGDLLGAEFCFCFGDYNISRPHYAASQEVQQAALPASSKVTDLAGRPDSNATTTAVGCLHLASCSGHGACNTATNTCDCFEGWGALADSMLIKAPDCSSRACPSSVSWASLPSSISDAHDPKSECSDRGICDYSTGMCDCFAGFTGAACQRTACPKQCSGHGRCVTVADLTFQDRAVPLVPAFKYDDGLSKNAWDADKIQGCICDSDWAVGLAQGQTQQTSWHGMDCGQRSCPSGDDPSTSGHQHSFYDETNCQYHSSNGAVWEGATQADGQPCYHDPSGSTAVCTLPSKYADIAAFNSAAGVTYGAAGNLCYVPCSNRGECGSDGKCRCYPGYGGEACSRRTFG